MKAPALLLQRFVVRTGRGPLAALWRLAYAVATRLIVAAVRVGHGDVAVYVKSGLASGTPVYGLSDLDLVAVTRDERTADRVRRRWRRLSRFVPLLRRVAPHFWVYTESTLREASTASSLTYGLDSAIPRAAYLGERLRDEMGLLARPGLREPAQEWRRLAGPRRLPEATRDPQERRIAAWLDLQFLWRYAYRACENPTPPHVPYLCVKLVADPVAIWLSLARNEVVQDRVAALERGLVELPEEEQALRVALELYGDLPRTPEAPLRDVLPALLRLTQRIARRIADEVAVHGETSVQLVDRGADLAVPESWTARLSRHLLDGAEPELLPLVDWRTLALPPPPDETLTVVLVPAAADPATLLAAIRASRPPGAYAAFRADDVLLFPTISRVLLRTVQCPVTDPVSFALAEGRSSAAFPNVAGWSIADWARRAVAEHMAWLASPASRAGDGGGEHLGLLFTAARAALLHASCDAGAPALSLTVGTVAAALGADRRASTAAADDAFAAYLEWRRDGVPPPSEAVAAFEREVRNLPAYADPNG